MFFAECLRNFEGSFSSASMGWLKLTENTGNSLYYGSKWERTDSIWQTASDQHVDSALEVKAKGWTATRPGHVHCSCPSFSWFQQLAISTLFFWCEPQKWGSSCPLGQLSHSMVGGLWRSNVPCDVLDSSGIALMLQLFRSGTWSMGQRWLSIILSTWLIWRDLVTCYEHGRGWNATQLGLQMNMLQQSLQHWIQSWHIMALEINWGRRCASAKPSKRTRGQVRE